MLKGKITHIFISGAQSVGKTTLVRKLREVLNYQLVEEAARRIILEEKLSKDDLNPKLNPDKCQALNLKLLKINSNAALEHRLENTIFDRGLDPLVYARFYLGKASYEELLRTNEAQLLIESCKKNGSIFVVYPQPECIVDDEIRAILDLDELRRFSDHMTELYTELGVKWTYVKMLDINERVALIIDTLEGVRNETRVKKA